MQPRISSILERIVQNNRVAGAYLFSGPPDIGKKEAADHFATLLECKKQDQIFIEPDGASLKIGQIRELQTWVRFGPTAGKHLLVTVEGADTLTGEAAAAFLKTLEEPAAGVVFALLVERIDRLPDTILSRCQKIIFADSGASWQPKEEYNRYYEDIKNIRQKAIVELFSFSSALVEQKAKIEDLLYDLAHFAHYKMRNVSFSRIILDSVRYIKRRANLKLTLDTMCLRLAEGSNVRT